MRRSARLLLTTLSEGGGVGLPPSGFNWPFGTYPLNIAPDYTTNFDPLDYIDYTSWAAFYVDVAAGNDANAGTTVGSPVQSIHRATTLGNATAAPFKVYVKSGRYNRSFSFTNGGGMVYPTQPCAYIATDGRVTCYAGSDLSWGAADGTYTNTYKVARSNVLRVIDRLNVDVYGDDVELTKVADAATCNTTPGSWAQVGSDLYVRRTDGAAVTNTNTEVLLLVDAFNLNSTSKSCYLEGFDFRGGSNGGVFVLDDVTRNVICSSVSAKYAGGTGNLNDGFRLLNNRGLVALLNCTAAANAKDGINGHWDTDLSPEMYVLTIGCEGRNNGRFTSQSNNGLTSHDGLVSIDVGGEYHHNYGPNVVPVNACQMWCVGTNAHDSFSDVSMGGSGPEVDFNAQATATLWLDSCQSAESTRSLEAGDTAAIKLRRFTEGAGQVRVTAGGASITGY